MKSPHSWNWIHHSVWRPAGLLAICIVVSALVSLDRGQMNWWDLINYHIYSPWSFLNHREGRDLFVAGIQSYFDPTVDIPYYLVAMKWLPEFPHLVAILASLPFAALIFCTAQLIRVVFAEFRFSGGRERFLIIGITLIASVTGVSTWSQAITSTNEVIIAVPLVAGLTLLLGAFRLESPKRMSSGKAALIGASFGLAAGLKLTAAIYAPAGGLLLLAACRDWKNVLACGTSFFSGWLALFLLFWGPWAWHLYEHTGNPLFPMFNNIFHSSYSAPHGGQDNRFLPRHILQWWFYPFYWLKDAGRTVFPLSFRDARFAAAYVLGMLLLVHGIVRSRKSPGTNRVLFALAAFWFIAYVTWLVVFSILRYAIVLEIGAVIVAIGAVLSWCQTRPRLAVASIRITLTFAFAASVMAFARIPDLGHVPFGPRTFSADVPNLGKNPLVILGDQPMGLLAPLIADSNPGATFIGMPRCFRSQGWCYRDYYAYGLGKAMRDKIDAHRGPIFMAYYTNRIPVFPQLNVFGLHADTGHCLGMTSNRTPDVLLCRVEKSPIASPMPPDQGFRLALKTNHARPDVHVTAAWESNPCVQKEQMGRLYLSWSMPADAGHVSVYITSKPSMQRTLFARSGNTGNATTGNWVRAGQDFMFTDSRGRPLAKASVYYQPCR